MSTALHDLQGAESVVVIGRSQDSQAMAERITDEVNGILCQEAGAPTLSKQAVLDLIDQGASQGGPQAGPAYLPLPLPSPPPPFPLFLHSKEKSSADPSRLNNISSGHCLPGGGAPAALGVSHV